MVTPLACAWDVKLYQINHVGEWFHYVCKLSPILKLACTWYMGSYNDCMKVECMCCQCKCTGRLETASFMESQNISYWSWHGQTTNVNVSYVAWFANSILDKFVVSLKFAILVHGEFQTWWNLSSICSTAQVLFILGAPSFEYPHVRVELASQYIWFTLAYQSWETCFAP